VVWQVFHALRSSGRATPWNKLLLRSSCCGKAEAKVAVSLRETRLHLAEQDGYKRAANVGALKTYGTANISPVITPASITPAFGSSGIQWIRLGTQFPGR